MDPLHENCYQVFVRTDPGHGETPERAERPIVLCSSYAEARRVRREFQADARDCVIRYVGPGGGGD
jgi:hypothetical protein